MTIFSQFSPILADFSPISVRETSEFLDKIKAGEFTLKNKMTTIVGNWRQVPQAAHSPSPLLDFPQKSRVAPSQAELWQGAPSYINSFATSNLLKVMLAHTNAMA